MDFSKGKKACFHYIRKGDCWLTSADKVARLGPGDLLYIEAGLDHTLANGEPRNTGQAAQSSTLLLCGYCEFETSVAHPLLESLPTMIELQLYEIANQVGYESYLAFAKAFKRLFGMTPTMYRKQKKQRPD